MPKAAKAGAAAVAEKDVETQLNLMPAPDVAAGTTQETIWLSVDEMEPDPTQPRTNAEQSVEEDAGFVESIRREGVLEPIKVRPHPDPSKGIRYAIIFGERRWRASRKVGRPTIPSIIQTGESADDELKRLLQQAAENLHKTLEPLDEARFFKRLQLLTKGSVAQVAKIVGQPKSTVSDRLAMVDAPAPFQSLFISGALTASAAPIIKQYADVPIAILEAVAKEAVDDWRWGAAIDKGKAVPLNFVEDTLEGMILGGEFMRELPEQITLAYQADNGGIVAVKGKTYATDLKLFAKHHKKWERERQAKAKKEGKPAPAEKPVRSEPNPWAKQQRDQQKKRKRETQRRTLQFLAIVQKLPPAFDHDWLQAIIDWLTRELPNDTCRVLVRALGLEPKKGGYGGPDFDGTLRAHAQTLTSSSDLARFVVQLLLGHDLFLSSWSSSPAKRLETAAKLTGVNIAKIKLPDDDGKQKPKAAAPPKVVKKTPAKKETKKAPATKARKAKAKR